MRSIESDLVYLKCNGTWQTVCFAAGIHDLHWVLIIVYENLAEGANFAFRLRNSMNSNDFELLFMKSMCKDQTLRFATVISGIPGSLNYLHQAYEEGAGFAFL